MFNCNKISKNRVNIVFRVLGNEVFICPVHPQTQHCVRSVCYRLVAPKLFMCADLKQPQTRSGTGWIFKLFFFSKSTLINQPSQA